MLNKNEKRNRTINQCVEKYFEGNIYNYDNSIIIKYYPLRVVEKISLEDFNKVKCLELGLGHGYSTPVLEKYFADYTVLEGDYRIIEKYKKEHIDSKVKIIETYFEDYCTKEKYDIIILGFVLEHVDDPQSILVKYSKMLSETGRLFITVPNSEALNRRLGNLMGILENINELSGHDLEMGHKRYYNVRSLKKECENAGLEIVNLEGIFLKPFTTKQLLSLNLSQSVTNALCEVGRSYPELSLALFAEVKRGKVR